MKREQEDTRNDVPASGSIFVHGALSSGLAASKLFQRGFVGR